MTTTTTTMTMTTTTMTKKKIQQSTTQEIRDESGSGCSGNMPQQQW